MCFVATRFACEQNTACEKMMLVVYCTNKMQKRKRRKIVFSVIFDMDGTLLDTQRIYIPAWTYAGEQQGFADMGRCIYDVCGMNEVSWTKYLRERVPSLCIPQFKHDILAYVDKHRVLRTKPGAKELLAFLQDRGVKLAVASSSPREEVLHHLSALNLESYFTVIVGGADVQHGKPAPDIFLHAAKLLQTPSADCFVFEDSANGVRAAHAAKMKCIGVPDIVPFEPSVKALLHTQLASLADAVVLFEPFFA